MRKNKIKELWRQGKPATSAWSSTGDPFVVEILGHMGVDAVVIDMQHGMGITADKAARGFQVLSSTPAVPMARVPWNDPAQIQYVLDAGAYGVVVPLINSYDDAARAGQACRYSPKGYRSVGPNRVRFYAGEDYFTGANDEVICLVMIEDIKTVQDKLEEICKAPGIDGLYIGPSDLSVTMGGSPGLGQTNAKHLAACQRVLDAANTAGLVAGIHAVSASEAKYRFAQGFKFCHIGSDIRYLDNATKAAMAELNNPDKWPPA